MPLRRKRRRPIRPNLYFRPMPRRKRAALIFLIIAVVLFIIFYGMVVRIRPIILSLATSEVYEVVMNDINDVISEEISSGSMSYGNLITLQKDYSGNITALETNMPMVNKLQAEISKSVVNNIENRIISDIKIPVGNVLGGVIFSGRGPSLVVKILSVASVQTRFINSFSEEGINQTRHKIMLEVTANIDIFVPGTRETTTTVTTLVEVAETVIVGEVPDVYADIGQSG